MNNEQRKFYEIQYLNNLTRILQLGVREKNSRTQLETLRIPSSIITVDLAQEFPILQSKKVYWKSAAQEILWIMQKQSNITADLNSNIWDKWTGEDGTIGKAYGYQVRQPVTRGEYHWNNQVSYVLDTLKRDPSNRQCVINLWNVSDLDKMNLVPCAFSSVWNIIDNRLNCMLIQRSADYPVGVPFNTTQYAILTHLFARHLGVSVGILTHVMADSHIYVNQIEGVQQQLRQWTELEGWGAPKLEITGPTDFWKVNIEDINVTGYNPAPAIKFEVAK